VSLPGLQVLNQEEGFEATIPNPEVGFEVGFLGLDELAIAGDIAIERAHLDMSDTEPALRFPDSEYFTFHADSFREGLIPVVATGLELHELGDFLVLNTGLEAAVWLACALVVDQRYRTLRPSVVTRLCEPVGCKKRTQVGLSFVYLGKRQGFEDNRIAGGCLLNFEHMTEQNCFKLHFETPCVRGKPLTEGFKARDSGPFFCSVMPVDGDVAHAGFPVVFDPGQGVDEEHVELRLQVAEVTHVLLLVSQRN
jgi:hypothetical protein